MVPENVGHDAATSSQHSDSDPNGNGSAPHDEAPVNIDDLGVAPLRGDVDEYFDAASENSDAPLSEEDINEDLPDDDDEEIRWNNGPEIHISPEEAYLRDASRTPLFTDSRVSMLNAVILIINCLRTHGASAALTNELFTLLAKVLLP